MTYKETTHQAFVPGQVGIVVIWFPLKSKSSRLPSMQRVERKSHSYIDSHQGALLHRWFPDLSSYFEEGEKRTSRIKQVITQTQLLLATVQLMAGLTSMLAAF